MGRDLSADSFSWWIRCLYLAARKIERLAVSVGRKLALYSAALYGADCVRLHWLAPVYRALAHAWAIHVCHCCARPLASLLSRFLSGRHFRGLFPFGHRHLEFCLYVGVRGDWAGAAVGGPPGRAHRIWAQLCRSAHRPELPI